MDLKPISSASGYMRISRCDPPLRLFSVAEKRNNVFQRTHSQAIFSLVYSSTVAGYGPLKLAVMQE